MADLFGFKTQRDSRSRTAACGPIPPVHLVESGGEGGADQQVIVPAAGRDGPAQQLPRTWQHFVGAGRELMAGDAGDVDPVVGVLRDVAAGDEADEGRVEI